MERQGIVRRSDSSWASPLHMVRKADGSWRPCGDFRRLNLQTKPDLYTCPNIGDLTARLAGCRVFSKLDLRKGYHQIPVRAEAVPLAEITADSCADAFAHNWVARFGVPEPITTDRGTQFSGAVWKCMCEKLGINHILTTAYHPQSKGLVERFHRQLKESLRARSCNNSWEEHLPWVLLGLRTAPKEESAVSSAEAVYGGPLALPGQAQTAGGMLVDPPPPPIPAGRRSYAEVAGGKPSILDGVDFVYIWRGAAAGPFVQTYSGPFQVLRRLGKVYELQVGERVETVAADRLKPHRGPAPAVARPPKRGRPPGTGGKVDLVGPGLGGGALWWIHEK